MATSTPQGISNGQPPSAVFFSPASFMPVVAYQGAGVDVIDENNRPYFWNGTRYVLPDASNADLLIPIAQKGAALGVATLNAQGQLPLSQLPPEATREFLGKIANQSAMLLLTGNKGDWCTRLDDSRDYELIASDPTLIGSWQPHSYPAVVVDGGAGGGGGAVSAVTDFNGRIGPITAYVNDLSDATATGKSLLLAADATAERSVLGLGTAATFNVANAGNAATTEVVKGNDSRLTDARTPNAHNQASTTVSYSNSSYPAVVDVKGALDILLYVAPLIQSLANSVNAVEIGRTIASVSLSWALNKVMSALSLDNGIGALTPSVVNFTHSGQAITANRTYTLTAGDGTNSVTASTSIVFQSKRYWGASPNTTLTDAQVLALTGQELSATRTKGAFTVAGGGGYVYYALPDSMGTPQFTVNGLTYTDLQLTTRAVVNASGASVLYRIYRTGSIQNGTLTMAVN